MSHGRTVVLLSMLTLACALLPLAGAGAAVLTWGADDPFAAGATITVDFGATATGVTALDVVATGLGGVQHWIIYQGIDNPSGSVPFEMTLACLDGGPDPHAGTSAWLPILAPFTEGLAFTPATDWTWLHDGVFTLEVSYVHGAFPDNPFCYGSGYELPTISRLDLVLTCEAAVATESGSWGAVKALFR